MDRILQRELAVKVLYAMDLQNNFSEKIFNNIYEEYILTKDLILKISEKTELLQDNEELKISLRRRMPYFNALNNLQVKLLEKQRNDENNDENLIKAIHTCINGIATGLRNSGWFDNVTNRCYSTIVIKYKTNYNKNFCD